MLIMFLLTLIYVMNKGQVMITREPVQIAVTSRVLSFNDNKKVSLTFSDHDIFNTINVF